MPKQCWLVHQTTANDVKRCPGCEYTKIVHQKCLITDLWPLITFDFFFDFCIDFHTKRRQLMFWVRISQNYSRKMPYQWFMAPYHFWLFFRFFHRYAHQTNRNSVLITKIVLKSIYRVYWKSYHRKSIFTPKTARLGSRLPFWAVRPILQTVTIFRFLIAPINNIILIN